MKIVNYFLTLLMVIPFCVYAETEQPSLELLEFLADWTEQEQHVIDSVSSVPTPSETEAENEQKN